MLVRGKYILTSAVPEEIYDGAFRVEEGVISEIGEWNYLNSKFPNDPVIGDTNDIIIPGLINVHGHFSESLITGIAEQFTLWE